MVCSGAMACTRSFCAALARHPMDGLLTMGNGKNAGTMGSKRRHNYPPPTTSTLPGTLRAVLTTMEAF